jgi:ABC-type phosphate transport system substrate-binding protein
MARLKWLKGMFVLFMASAILSPLYAIQGHAESDVLIICNRDVPDTTLTKDDIKNIFLGYKTEWSNKQKIICVTLEGSDVNETFMQEYVGKTSFQFIYFWRRQVFTGKGRPPQSFTTEESLVDFVSQTEGAVGYISAASIKDTVKIISVK